MFSLEKNLLFEGSFDIFIFEHSQNCNDEVI